MQYLIKNNEPRIFRKNNYRDSDKNKLRTFEPRGGENFKSIELQRKKSGSYIKKCMQNEFEFDEKKPMISTEIVVSSRAFSRLCLDFADYTVFL